MSVNSSCPCCSSSMLLHLNSRRSYWFCHHCRSEMPDLNHEKSKRKKAVNLSSALNKNVIASRKLAQMATI